MATPTMDSAGSQPSPHSPNPSLSSPLEYQDAALEGGGLEGSAGQQPDALSVSEAVAQTRSGDSQVDARSRGESGEVARSAADSITDVDSGRRAVVLVKAEDGDYGMPGAYFGIGSGEFGQQPRQGPRAETPDLRAEGVIHDAHYMEPDVSASDTLKHELSFKSIDWTGSVSDRGDSVEDSDESGFGGQEQSSLHEDDGHELKEDDLSDQRDASTDQDDGKEKSQGTEQSDLAGSPRSVVGDNTATPESVKSIRLGNMQAPPSSASEGEGENEDAQSQDTEAGLQSDVVFVQKTSSSHQDQNEEEDGNTASTANIERSGSYQVKDQDSAMERMRSAISFSMKTPLSSAADGDEESIDNKDIQPSLTSFYSYDACTDEEVEQECPPQNEEMAHSRSQRDVSRQLSQEGDTERPEISSWNEGESQSMGESTDDNDNAPKAEESSLSHIAELNSNASSNNSALGDIAHLYQNVSNPRVESVFPVHPPEHLRMHAGRSHGVSPLTKDITPISPPRSDCQPLARASVLVHHSLHPARSGNRRQSTRTPASHPQGAKETSRQKDSGAGGTTAEGRQNRASRTHEHHRPNSARIFHYKTSKSKGSLTPLERCLSSPTASKRNLSATPWQQNEHAGRAPSSEGSAKSRSASLREISSSHEAASTKSDGEGSCLEMNQLGCSDVSSMEGQDNPDRSNLPSESVATPQFAKTLLGKQERSHDKVVTSSSVSSRTSSKGVLRRKKSKPPANEGYQVSPLDQKLRRKMTDRAPVRKRQSKLSLGRHRSSPVGSAISNRDKCQRSSRSKMQRSGWASSPLLPTAAAVRGSRITSVRRVPSGAPAAAKKEKGKTVASMSASASDRKRAPGPRSSKEVVPSRDSKSLSNRRKSKTSKGQTVEQTAKKSHDKGTGHEVGGSLQEPRSKRSGGGKACAKSQNVWDSPEVQTCVNSLPFCLTEDRCPQNSLLRPITPESMSIHLYGNMSEDSDIKNPASPCLTNSEGGPLSPGAMQEGIRGRLISPTAVASAGHDMLNVLSCGTSHRSFVSSSQEDLLGSSFSADLSDSSMATLRSSVDAALSTGRNSNKNSPRPLEMHIPRPPSTSREGQWRPPNSVAISPREKQSASPLSISPRHSLKAGQSPRSLHESPRFRGQTPHTHSPLCDACRCDRTPRGEGVQSARQMNRDQRRTSPQRTRRAFQAETSKHQAADHPAGKRGYSPVMCLERSPEKICRSPVESTNASPVGFQDNMEGLPNYKISSSASLGVRTCLDLNKKGKETTPSPRMTPQITFPSDNRVSIAMDSRGKPSPRKSRLVDTKTADEGYPPEKDGCGTQRANRPGSRSSNGLESKSADDKSRRRLVSLTAPLSGGRRMSTSQREGSETSDMPILYSKASSDEDSRDSFKNDRTDHGSPIPTICITAALTSDEGSRNSNRSERGSPGSISKSSITRSSDCEDAFSSHPRLAHSRKSTNLSIKQEHSPPEETPCHDETEILDKSRPMSICSASSSSALSTGGGKICFWQSRTFEVDDHDPTSRNNSHPHVESNRDSDVRSPELSLRNEKLIGKEYIRDHYEEDDDGFHASEWVHARRLHHTHTGRGGDDPQGGAELMHGIHKELHHEQNSSVGFRSVGSHGQSPISLTGAQPKQSREHLKSPPPLSRRAPQLSSWEATGITDSPRDHSWVGGSEALAETASFQTNVESSLMESTNRNASPAAAERSNTTSSPKLETPMVEVMHSIGWGMDCELDRNDLTAERDVYYTGPPRGGFVVINDFGIGLESHATSVPPSLPRSQFGDVGQQHDRGEAVPVNELTDNGTVLAASQADRERNAVATQCETDISPTADTGTCIDKDFLPECSSMHKAGPRSVRPIKCRGRYREGKFERFDDSSNEFHWCREISDAQTQCERNITPTSDAATGIEADFFPQCQTSAARRGDPNHSPQRCEPPGMWNGHHKDSRPPDVLQKTDNSPQQIKKADASHGENPNSDTGSLTASTRGQKKKHRSVGHYSAKKRIQCPVVPDSEGQIEQKKETITLQREVLTRPKSDTPKFPEVLTPQGESQNESTSLPFSKKDLKGETHLSERETDRKEETMTMSSETMRKRERKKRKERRSKENVGAPCRETDHAKKYESDTTASSDNLGSRELKFETPKCLPSRLTAVEQRVKGETCSPPCTPQQSNPSELLDDDIKHSKQKKEEEENPDLQRPPYRQLEERTDKDVCPGIKTTPTPPTGYMKQRQQTLTMNRLEVPSTLVAKPSARKTQCAKHVKARRPESSSSNQIENDRKAMTEKSLALNEDAKLSMTSPDKSAASSDASRGGNFEPAPAGPADSQMMSPLDTAKAEEKIRAQRRKPVPISFPPLSKRRRHEAGTKDGKNAAKKKGGDDDDDDTTISESLEDCLWEERDRVNEGRDVQDEKSKVGDFSVLVPYVVIEDMDRVGDSSSSDQSLCSARRGLSSSSSLESLVSEASDEADKSRCEVVKRPTRSLNLPAQARHIVHCPVNGIPGSGFGMATTPLSTPMGPTSLKSSPPSDAGKPYEDSSSSDGAIAEELGACGSGSSLSRAIRHNVWSSRTSNLSDGIVNCIDSEEHLSRSGDSSRKRDSVCRGETKPSRWSLGEQDPVCLNRTGTPGTLLDEISADSALPGCFDQSKSNSFSPRDHSVEMNALPVFGQVHEDSSATLKENRAQTSAVSTFQQAWSIVQSPEKSLSCSPDEALTGSCMRKKRQESTDRCSVGDSSQRKSNRSSPRVNFSCHKTSETDVGVEENTSERENKVPTLKTKRSMKQRPTTDRKDHEDSISDKPTESSRAAQIPFRRSAKIQGTESFASPDDYVSNTSNTTPQALHNYSDTFLHETKRPEDEQIMSMTTRAASTTETREGQSLPERSHRSERQLASSPSIGFHLSSLEDLPNRDSEAETRNLSSLRRLAENPAEATHEDHGHVVSSAQSPKHRNKAKLRYVLTTRKTGQEEQPKPRRAPPGTDGMSAMIDSDVVEDSFPNEDKGASRMSSGRKDESDRTRNASPIRSASNQSVPLSSSSLTGSEVGSAIQKSLKEGLTGSSNAASPRRRQRRLQRVTMSPETSAAEVRDETTPQFPERLDSFDGSSRNGPMGAPQSSSHSAKLRPTKAVMVGRVWANTATPPVPPELSNDDDDASSRGTDSKTRSHTSVASWRTNDSSVEGGTEKDASYSHASSISWPRQTEGKGNFGEDCPQKNPRSESTSERLETSTATRHSRHRCRSSETATGASQEEALTSFAGHHGNPDMTDATYVDSAREDVGVTDCCRENFSYDDDFSQCTDFVPCSDAASSKHSNTAHDISFNEPSEPDVTQQTCRKSESVGSPMESLIAPEKSRKHSVEDKSSVHGEEEAAAAKRTSKACFAFNCGLRIQLTASPRNATTFEREDIEASSCTELGWPVSYVPSSQRTAYTASAGHMSGEACFSEDETDKEIENIFTAGFLKLASNQVARPSTPAAACSSSSNIVTGSKSCCSSKSDSNCHGKGSKQ